MEEPDLSSLRNHNALVIIVLLLFVGVVGMGFVVPTLDEFVDGSREPVAPPTASSGTTPTSASTTTSSPPGSPTSTAAEPPTGDPPETTRTSGGPPSSTTTLPTGEPPTTTSAPPSTTSAPPTTSTDDPGGGEGSGGGGSSGGGDDGSGGGGSSGGGGGPPSLDLSLGEGGDKTLVAASNTYPGDEGAGELTVENVGGRAGKLYVTVTSIGDLENGLTEPESEVDDTGGDPGAGNGELAEALEVRLAIVVDGERTYLAGGPNTWVTMEQLGDCSRAGGMTFPPGTKGRLVLEYRVPRSAGNEIQSDAVTVTVTVILEG